MPSFATFKAVQQPSCLPVEREDEEDVRASQRPKRVAAEAPEPGAPAAAAEPPAQDDDAEPTAESVAHALTVQMLETDQKMFDIMDKHMKDMRVYMIKRSQIMAAMLTSQKFRDVRNLKRSAEAPSERASMEAKRQVAEQVQKQAAEETRIKRNMLSSYRMAAEILAKNAPGARQIVERICIDVCHAVRQILASAGAHPHARDMRAKLDALQAAMGDPEGETRKRVQAAVYSPPRRGKKKTEEEEQEYMTLGSLAEFIKTTNGGRGMIRAATVDEIMRAIVSTQRLEQGLPDIPHFEKTLSDEWGVPNLFKMSNGILIINGETFASTMIQVSAA
jgi:hypothetical protein